jgi:hypothetical protein
MEYTEEKHKLLIIYIQLLCLVLRVRRVSTIFERARYRMNYTRIALRAALFAILFS